MYVAGNINFYLEIRIFYDFMYSVNYILVQCCLTRAPLCYCLKFIIEMLHAKHRWRCEMFVLGPRIQVSVVLECLR